MKNTDSGIIGTKIVLSSIKTNDIHHLCDFFSKPYIYFSPPVAGENLIGGMSAPVIKCKKTPRKKCSFMAEEAKKR